MSEDPYKYHRMFARAQLERLHISHLHRYVSAYAATPVMLARLEESIVEAFIKVRERGHGFEIVDQDGEGCLMICHGGQIRLLLPYREFDGETEGLFD
jgi:Uri superfamily endonuclease